MCAEWTGVFGRIHMRLRSRKDGIIRVTRDLTGDFRESVHSAVCGCPEGTWVRESEEDAEGWSMPGITVRADRADGALSFFDREGRLLLCEPREHPAELESVEIRRAVFQGASSVRESMGADGMRASADPFETRRDRMGVRGRQRFCFQEGEALYGLGSHEEGTGNLRGHDRMLYQHNLKAVVPVLVSTEGWAVLFDMGCGMTFHDGCDGSWMEIDCADALNWYFVYGDGTYESLMEKLQGLTGQAPMLPRYALGYIQSRERYLSAEELISVAAEYRRRKVPLDMIVQDWQSWP